MVVGEEEGREREREGIKGINTKRAGESGGLRLRKGGGDIRDTARSEVEEEERGSGKVLGRE